jgi:DNA-binding SARP family transcriptional activator
MRGGEAAGAPQLRFTVLGPVSIRRDDGEVLPSGSPQQRALLAALLLRNGRTATALELIDAIWGEDAPTQALAVTRTYASRLRKILGISVLHSESGGYALRVPEDAVDLGIARRLTAQAQKLLAAGDVREARARMNEALGLWDGEALTAVPGPFADSQRARLEEWRLQLLEARLDADLEIGAHAEAVSELTALTDAYPLRERLRELLMLALYRSGRQAEALAVYADTRRLLADELGVDPRPELAELQRRILAADVTLSTSGGLRAPRAAPASAAYRPAQLPAREPYFAGRATAVHETVRRLTSAEDEAATPVVAVSGMAGAGKTAFALEVGHAVRPYFPDGQLYAHLDRPREGTADVHDVLGDFLQALGVPRSELPDRWQARAALYRSALDGRRILVVLDDVREAAQVRPLLPGTAGCAALVTGRGRMVDLAGAQLVDLDVMSPEEAVQFFAGVVGAERVADEREAVLDVVAACGFLPLAIRIAASRLAARRTWTVAVLAARLADERRRLEELRAGDLAVKSSFELGYGQLDPAGARAFRLLALADGPDIPLAAAAAVLDLPEHHAEDLLEGLVDASLLESVAPQWYRYHDLLRLFARACCEREEEAQEREAALLRLERALVHTLVHARDLDGDHARVPAPAPAPAVHRGS